MKMYFVCSGPPNWLTCYGVLENGFVFGSHLCSHPGFAPGDLYFQRPDRIEGLKQVFGIDPTAVDAETIVVTSQEEVPDWWETKADNHDVQLSLKPQYDLYRAILDKSEPPRDGGEDVDG